MNGFYLRSRHGDCGDNVMFHNKNGHGYGTDLDKLHVFSLKEAQKQLDWDIGNLPLLKSAVDNASIRAINHQYLDKNENKKYEGDEYIVQIKGFHNGNDIAFIVLGGKTFNYSEATILSKIETGSFPDSTHFIIWNKLYLDTLSRRTFQPENINTRKMITSPGIKYKKPRNRETTGKVRWNCHCCGKINWQFNPYDFEGCVDIYCDEYRY